MKRILHVCLFLAFLLAAIPAHAQVPSAFPYVKPVQNDSSVGTTQFTLTKINSSGNAVIMATTDTNGYAGVCVSNCGKTGTAWIAFAGLVPLTVDATATVQHYITISSTTGGDGHDSGAATYPTSGAVIGRVQAGATSGNQAMVDLFSAEVQAASSPVSSVSNSDGTLTISPTTGAVVASLALGHANTWTGAQSFSALGTFSGAGAASTPGLTVTGAPYTGGTATTNFPIFYVNDGTGPTTLSTAGTEIGVNTPSGFTGNLFDFHVNGGASVAKLDYGGNLTVASCAGCGGSPSLLAVTLGFFAPATGTAYVNMLGITSGSQSTAIPAELVSPRAGTMQSLIVKMQTGNTQGAGATYQVTLYQNGATTALTCTIASSAGSCTDSTHIVTIAAGDLLAWQTVQTGTGSGSYYYISADMQ